MVLETVQLFPKWPNIQDANRLVLKKTLNWFARFKNAKSALCFPLKVIVLIRSERFMFNVDCFIFDKRERASVKLNLEGRKHVGDFCQNKSCSHSFDFAALFIDPLCDITNCIRGKESNLSPAIFLMSSWELNSPLQ